MARIKLLLTALLTLSTATVLPSAAWAKNEEWRDTQGNKFKGEPTEVFGPFAIFKTSRMSGRRLPLQYLAPADCVRIQQIISQRPGLAADWSKSNTPVAADLKGNIQRLEGGKLVPATLAGRPEPHFLVVTYCTSGNSTSWEILDQALAGYAKIQKEHPGLVEFLFFGLKHDRPGHRKMVTDKNVPWLIADFDVQNSMTTISGFAPAEEGYGLLVLTADGVPLFQEVPANPAAATTFLDNFKNFLDLAVPENPRAWKDRLHYLRATLTASHANDDCGPTLVGQVLSAEALKRHGTTALKATLTVAASGEVTKVQLDPNGVPEKLRGAITDALRQCAFVPAISKGKFIDGSYAYELKFN